MPEPHTELKDIFSDHTDDLKQVEEELLLLFESKAFLIPQIGRHIVSSGGKRVRPLFLLLSAALSGFTGRERITLGAIIEAIHTASLLHDDVVDGASIRRGKKTAHTLWGNQVVILVGDFLYSRALKTAVGFKNQAIMEALSAATTMMTEGEIFQLGKIGDPHITMEEYYRIISAKTGALISAACRIGGILGGLKDDHIEALSGFGMKTGMVFQMADDVLDYMADQDTFGKQLGKDLSEGKITVPLIKLLQVCTDAEREEVKRIITGRGVENGKSLSILDDLFGKYSILEKSLAHARGLLDEAVSELSVFPDSPERDALIGLAEYSLQRKN
ncbi:MAG: polyprenyl synthetase family protein [Nitrospirae bacterium]|nr:MAG: polyprenyl synthetase family protein [Nitrospirota bacterium]